MQYQLILTQYHQLPASISIYWRSTSKYQLVSLVIYHLVKHIWANWIITLFTTHLSHLQYPWSSLTWLWTLSTDFLHFVGNVVCFYWLTEIVVRPCNGILIICDEHLCLVCHVSQRPSKGSSYKLFRPGVNKKEEQYNNIFFGPGVDRKKKE